MNVTHNGATDVGQVRKRNEDHFLVDESLGLYVVCDGMGGHAGGELASRTAAETVRAWLAARTATLRSVARGEVPGDQIAGLLQEGIQAASATVHQIGVDDETKRGLGTTCVALVVAGDKAVLGHVGDSRMYLSRGGEVYRLTEDHTFVQEAVRRGMMTAEDAKVSPHQNLVTRAVGPKPSVLVDTLVFDLLPGDTLLLCSDGLHSYVNESAELKAALEAPSLEAIGPRLVATANERGGSDNITALVVRAVVERADERQQTIRASRVNAELAALQHIALFTELDMLELVKVANACEHRHYETGEAVVREGADADTLYILSEGDAEVSRGGLAVATLRAGDHFGEMAMLSNKPRSATVTTLSPCSMLTLDRARFYELMSGDPVIAAKFLWRLAQTLSVRLDDVYLLQDRLETDRRRADEGRQTRVAGLFPSPFDRR